jgi:hypothetical protein
MIQAERVRGTLFKDLQIGAKAGFWLRLSEAESKSEYKAIKINIWHIQICQIVVMERYSNHPKLYPTNKNLP